MVPYNIYVQQTFVDLFKIVKTHSPISIYNLFSFSVRDSSCRVYLPKVKLNISKNNYVFRSSELWNSLISKVLEKNKADKDGLVIRGSARNSDFCATIPYIKQKLKGILLCRQKLGNQTDWCPPNFG